MKIRTGLGQDSHRFEAALGKPLKLGGVLFEDERGLEGNSDADVVLHALCNALTGVHGGVVLGPMTDALCAAGVKDGKAYVKEALKHLGALKLNHVSVSLECQQPKIGPKIADMRASLAELLGLEMADVAITATTGEGLTAFGRGEGIQALVVVTAVQG